MKFTKLAKSDKFEYMMLSRLIQDAKYFIEHPDLKHLWARTLDEHIKQMKEQYAKLDPKPEWISEEEINNLAKQMKESYTNHWNEVHPDNKIEAAIQQPNKPKPTTMLPDNMQWAWDPDAADWVAVLKDNSNTTPPLYDPNNQNVVNNTTTYMSNIKSASVIDGDEDEDPLSVRLNDLFLSDSSLVDSYIKKEISCDDILNALNIEIKNKREYKKVCNYIKEFIQDNYMGTIKSATLEITDKNGKAAEEGMWLYKPMNHSTFRGDIPVRLFQVKIRRQKDGTDKPYLLSENKLITKGISHIKDGILFDTYEEAKQYSESHKTKEEKEFDKLDDWQKTDYYLSKQSSCLSKFLDGPQYSKEIKIEAGLIKEGLVKYAGFDFNRGTKYAITAKGLEVLRNASEKEHNEALNEREKLAYMFGFNTDEVSTLDTTGKVIKSDDKPNKIKKINIESLKNKLYRAIKNERKGLDDALDYVNIRIKNEEGGVTVYVSDELSYDGLMKLAEVINKVVQEIDKDAYFEPLDSGTLVSFVSDGTPLNFDASLHKTAKQWTICEADGSELGKVTASSELDAKVKFGIEHPEYVDSQSICAKEIKSGLEYSGAFEYNDYKIDLFKDTDDGATFVIYAPEGKTVNHESMYKGTASTMDEAITKAYNIIDGSKEIDAKKLPLYKQKDPYYSDEAQISLFKTSINDVKRNFEQIAGIPLKQFCLIYKENNNEEFKKIYDKITDYISKKYNYNVKSMQWFHSFCDMIEKQCNKKDAQYEQTTNTKEPYPNPSETPNDHIILENHDGWVNTASFEDDVRKQFQKPHQKLPNSDRDLELLEKQVLDLIDEDKKEQIKALFDKVQFSDKEAAKVTPEFAKLHKLLGEYRKQNLIQLSDLDGNLVASGDPQIINELEHQVKDIGYYCESVDEYTDSDYAETYSLKIFMK